MTQKEMGRTLNIDPMTLAKIERGNNKTSKRGYSQNRKTCCGIGLN